ncbi:MAG: YfcE family phosphodiesterase [Promethearchaeota archaeon]|nr:MAG: YfcE family phosphodiesterase [Candidatus Lokiarchaeota archaeon]
MKTIILVIGDTHISSFKDLPKEILQKVKESNWVFHVGDYISPNIVGGFKQLKHDCFKGVYGNADPLAIRKLLPPKVLIEISDIRIGIIHPETGGPDTYLKKRVINEFRHDKVNLIAYGHSHEATIEWVDKTLLVNPGRGYIDEYSNIRSASIAIITIDKEIKAEIKEINH